MYFEVEGQKIYHKIFNESKKKTIIFLHGLGTDHSSFRNYVGYFKDYRLILIDLPGFGKSLSDHRLGYDDEVDLVTKLIKQLKLKEFYLVGYSLGGTIALPIALKKSAGFKKIILINSPVTLTKVSFSKHLMLYLRILITYTTPFRFMAKYVSNRVFPKDKRMREEFLKQIMISHRKTYRKIVWDLRKYDLSKEVKKLAKNIYVIHGSADRVINGKNQSRFVPKNNVGFVKGGHGLFKENQIAETCKLALAYLKG